MYLATVNIDNKFIGDYFDVDTITDQMRADAALNGVGFVLVSEPPTAKNSDDLDAVPDFGSSSNEEIDATVAMFSAKLHQEYLISTDWYVLRKVETDEAIPAEVLVKRAEARLVLGK